MLPPMRWEMSPTTSKWLKCGRAIIYEDRSIPDVPGLFSLPKTWSIGSKSFHDARAEEERSAFIPSGRTRGLKFGISLVRCRDLAAYQRAPIFWRDVPSTLRVCAAVCSIQGSFSWTIRPLHVQLTRLLFLLYLIYTSSHLTSPLTFAFFVTLSVLSFFAHFLRASIHLHNGGILVRHARFQSFYPLSFLNNQIPVL